MKDGSQRILDAVESADPAVEDLPGGFQRRPDGIWRAEGRGEEVVWNWLCSPLFVDALTRDERGGGWGFRLRFIDQDGRTHFWSMPSSELAGDGLELRRHLLSNGFSLATGKAARDALNRLIAAQRPTKRLHSVDRGGWADARFSAFILGDRVIGDENSAETIVLQASTAASEIYSQRGTLAGWQGEIAARCLGNSQLQFLISAALVCPLCQPLGIENIFLNLIGNSSMGKSTGQIVAASVWYPKLSILSWRSTSNGLQASPRPILTVSSPSMR